MLILNSGLKKYRKVTGVILFLAISNLLTGQVVTDSIPSKATLSQCLAYALANQDLIKQSQLDEDIARKDIYIALSGWYPQMEIDVNVEHFLQPPLTSYPNLSTPKPYNYVTVQSPTPFVSTGIFSVNQTIYSSNLMLAARTSKELRKQASENIVNSKINVYVDVTKAFFDVLLTVEKLNFLNEDIQRLQRNYNDAYLLYQKGLRDNIDYQRTEISLSNAVAQRKSTEQSQKAKYSILKHLIGVVPEKQFTVLYDSSNYEHEILVDTTVNLDYNNRIEYQLMQSALNLQGSEVSYYRYSFLPTLSAFYNYTPQYGNTQLSNLYNSNNPSSLLGLKLTLPLFEGMNKLENLGKAKLQYKRLQLGMDFLKSEINSEYTQALTNYISSLNDLKTAKNNVAVARRIYNTVKFQYDKGIKAYLEVIVSETDLRESELNYLNILYEVITSKLDYEKALGTIKID